MNINNVKKIPFYLHVPRSAGSYFTYVSHGYLKNLFENAEKQHRVVQVRVSDFNFFATVRFNSDYWMRDENLIKVSTLRPMGKSETGPKYSNSRACKMCTLEGYLTNGEANLLMIKTLTTPDRKITMRESIFSALCLCDKFNYEPVKVGTLRDPLERAISMFNYLSSNESKHELSHNPDTENFEEAILNRKIDNNWIVRNLSGNLSGPLNKYWALNAICLLRDNNFHIFKTQEANKAVTFALQACFSERVSSKYKNFFKNESCKILQLEEISNIKKEAKAILAESLAWDELLYKSLTSEK